VQSVELEADSVKHTPLAPLTSSGIKKPDHLLRWHRPKRGYVQINFEAMSWGKVFRNGVEAKQQPQEDFRTFKLRVIVVAPLFKQFKAIFNHLSSRYFHARY